MVELTKSGLDTAGPDSWPDSRLEAAVAAELETVFAALHVIAALCVIAALREIVSL
jgi:hypothetical protein